MGVKKHAWSSADYWLTAGVMCLMGGYYWAIRGTTGYGGETGGMLAGFGWALLWYAFSQVGDGAERRPYGTPWLLLAIPLGIGFGGFTGYGVYISWLQGKFHLSYPEGLRPVGAWTGYAMLFLCGIHWGGNTGCFMAWCAPKRALRKVDWAIRIGCGLAGAIGAALFVRAYPQLFLPFYNEGIYSVKEYATCQRALTSIRTIAPHVGLILGFLAYEIARGDWRAAAVILTMAIGFAIPFSAGGYWQTFQDSPLKISWWKNWEMSIGLGGGLAFGLAFWWFNKPGTTAPAPLGRTAQAFFRSGFPLWLPFFNVLQGAYDGYCQIYSLEPTKVGYVLLVAASVAPFFAAWYSRKKMATTDESYRLPVWAVIAFQSVIVAAGILVSIPREWQLENMFLACAYAIYLGVSLVLIAVFWIRQRGALAKSV